MATKLELAYLAGCLDSDGCIRVKRSTYAMRVLGEAGAPVFSEHVGLRQVTPQVPHLLQATFGGSLYQHKAQCAGGRPLWRWECTDQKAAACLRAVLPYLRIKRGQAENCLALRKLKEKSKRAKVAKGRGHAGAAARSTELTDAMEACYGQSGALNKTGI